MLVTASEIFDFLDNHQAAIIDRYEITSACFAVLRRSVRKLVLLLTDSDDSSLELWEALRALLSEWLTVPVPFSEMRGALVAILGSADAVTVRWGRDVGGIYSQALAASADFPEGDTPMRECLRDLIVGLKGERRDFRIFCHSRAQRHFDSILAGAGLPPLGPDAFLRSVREYRSVRPFETLIKAGPLRAGGWGSAPDALLTAPRFEHLVQVVWWGCGDEPGFGYDPVSPSATEANDGGRRETADSRSVAVRWTTRQSRFGDELPSDATDLDELQAFREMEQDRGLRPATLLQLDSGFGILYPPHSQVLSFDPDPSETNPVQYRVPGHTLARGMYLVRPIVNELDLGGVHAEYDSYSRTWKEQLAHAVNADELSLTLQLTRGGLDLEDLHAAIRNWRKPPSTVIHAPRQRKHFVILMGALGLAGDEEGKGGLKAVPFWQRAWNEIRRSRGQAIQAGVQEHEIVDEQLQTIVRQLMPDIRLRSKAARSFSITIPSGGDLRGSFEFSVVLETESGFRAPESQLRTILPTDAIEQWRA
jgi:hypothetical protein